MARAGLGAGWRCGFANDFDPSKAATYKANWGDDHLHVADVNSVAAADLPGYADLVWASFPCQDLSLAGNARGLGTEQAQTRSGAFWAFWRVMLDLRRQGRAPALIVLENVYGILTANGGRDFATIARALALEDYRFGAMLLDAVHFLPQSRPRVFIVGVRGDLEIPAELTVLEPTKDWHPPAMSAAIGRLAEVDQDRWLWFSPPKPSIRSTKLISVIEDNPSDVPWHSSEETARLIGMMGEASLAKLAAMKALGTRTVGTIYKRTRPNASGNRVQRAELRNDQIAGCLRTPGGGSSRQIVIVVEGGSVRTRLLSAREAARLMGLPDSYKLPARYNDAYHVAGDGLVVPVVRYLAATILEPILTANAHENFLVAAE